MPSHLTTDATPRIAEPGGRAAPSLGQLLRSARESRGLTIDQIATETKIGKRLLEAIEEDDYDRLPGGIFDRAFIRAFAREVGIDGEHGVSLYLKAVGPRGRADRARSGAPSMDLVIVAGGIALALLLAIALWYFS